MKRLTIDQTWEQCLAMWKWIDSAVQEGNFSSVNSLKEKWLRDNCYNPEEIDESCFLCEYTKKRGRPDSCELCPARKVDAEFQCDDESNGYHFLTEPRLFYAELKRLNKIRLERKRK